MKLQPPAKKFDPVEYFNEFDSRDYLRFDFIGFKGDLSVGGSRPS